MSKENEDNSELKVQIDPKGSLGLLAIGDIGLRTWRLVKQENSKKESDDKK